MMYSLLTDLERGRGMRRSRPIGVGDTIQTTGYSTLTGESSVVSRAGSHLYFAGYNSQAARPGTLAPIFNRGATLPQNS
jgi:hypothetical protein